MILKSLGALNATIKIDNIIVKCYFFLDTEIENDITPREIKSLDDHDKLLKYMLDVSSILGKRIVLTPENYSEDETELIAIDKGEVIIY